MRQIRTPRVAAPINFADYLPLPLAAKPISCDDVPHRGHSRTRRRQFGPVLHLGLLGHASEFDIVQRLCRLGNL